MSKPYFQVLTSHIEHFSVMLQDPASFDYYYWAFIRSPSFSQSTTILKLPLAILTTAAAVHNDFEAITYQIPSYLTDVVPDLWVVYSHHPRHLAIRVQTVTAQYYQLAMPLLFDHQWGSMNLDHLLLVLLS